MSYVKDKAGKVYPATIQSSYKLYKHPIRWNFTRTLSIDVVEVNGKFLRQRYFNTFFDDVGDPFTFCDAAGNKFP